MRISNPRRTAQWIYARTRLLDLELVHPVISENVSWRALAVVLHQELHPNQTVYVLIDARAVLDSSGKPFVGLAGSDLSSLPVRQSTTTTMVVSFAELVQLAGRNASFRIALRAKAEVLCGKNTMIRKGLQIGHNDCPNAGLDKSRAYMKGNLDFISATKCSLDDIRDVLANNRRWQGVRTGQISNVDLVSLSGPTSMVHRRPVSSSCFALERRCFVQAPQRLCWIPPTLLSWTERQSSFSQSSLRRWAYSILHSIPMRSR